MELPQILTLQPSEWEKYKNLRLRALKEEPTGIWINIRRQII